MGLDSVELLVTVEEAFGISFTDPEAEKIATVGDLYKGVWSKIKDREQIENNKCKSAVLFYKFRNYFETEFDSKRKEIVPNSLLKNILPEVDIKTKWAKIEDGLELELPNLTHSKNITTALFITGITLIFGGFFLPIDIIKEFGNSQYWWLMPIIGIGATTIMVKSAKPLKTTIPLDNIRELIDEVLLLNYAKISKQLGTNRLEVENVIKLIIQDRTGVELKEIVPEASFTHDLGID